MAMCSKVTIWYQLISHLAWVITLGRSPALSNLVRTRRAADTPNGATWCLYGSCDLFVLYFCIYILEKSHTHTCEQIFAHKRRGLVKGKPFWGWEMCSWEILGCFALNTPQNGSQWAIYSQNKMSNNFQTLRDTRSISLIMSLFQIPSAKPASNLAEKSRWRHIRLAIKPRYLGNHAFQIKSYKGSLIHYQEVMFALSESVFKKCVQRPLAEDWRWRHIRLAIKPRYLGNHAFQIKRYSRTLSWTCGRSFRIRQEKVCAAPPDGGIIMTPFPVGNKTSLCPKRCIPDKKLL